MNPFAVEWGPVPEDQLADIWIQAPDRRAVTAAEDAIQKILARDPLGQGTEVAEGLRKLTVPPLTAYYQVLEAQKVVQLQAVAYTP